MPKISAVIVITENPPYALKAIQSINPFVNEIIVGAVRTNNQLLSVIKKNPKARIVQLPPDVPYADIVKEDLKKMAKNDYVLFIDPDEIIPPKTWKVIENNINRFDSFHFPRKNIIFGKWIQNSRWWPDYQLRFFKKDTVNWPRQIHPIPKATGKEYKIPSEEQLAITHYNYSNLDEYFEKAIRYAKSEALVYIQSNTQLQLTDTVRKALTEFVSRFFANEGYRDGMHGFVLAILQLFYYCLVQMYYWEYKKYPDEKLEVLVNSVSQFFQTGTVESNHWINKKYLVNPLARFKMKLINRVIRLFGRT